MDHYVDIKLLPDPEFAAHQLMSALYAKLHRALVKQSPTNIGVSFPEHDDKAPHLGNCLRLHGSANALRDLALTDWLTGMRDHVAVTAPSEVPAHAQHRTVRRIQVKSNPERLRRRLMRRHGIDENAARQRIPDETADSLTLPYLQLASSSTGQRFRLFLEHGPIGDRAKPGGFNSFGLSHEATVPWF